MKILFSYRTPDEKDKAQAALAGHEVIFHEGSLDGASYETEGVECLCVFVNSHVTKDVIDSFPALRLVATRSTGYDHIDIAHAHEKGIVVANVPAYGQRTVAEFVFALLLAVARRVIEGKERVNGGSFSPEGLQGFDLSGKTIGVVGTGAIGRNVIRIARGFSMDVLAFDLHQDESFAREAGFSYVSMDDLLARSDVVTLHVPENPHTKGLMNAEAFSKMKKDAYLINTSRGGVIVTEALVDALREERIAGAALDVLEEEGYVEDELSLLGTAHPSDASLRTLLLNHYLIAHPRVLVTPHMAFNTAEAVERILQTTFETLRSFADGKDVPVVS
jgi:D-lactate dehydrogenase